MGIPWILILKNPNHFFFFKPPVFSILIQERISSAWSKTHDYQILHRNSKKLGPTFSDIAIFTLQDEPKKEYKIKNSKELDLSPEVFCYQIDVFFRYYDVYILPFMLRSEQFIRLIRFSSPILPLFSHFINFFRLLFDQCLILK